MATLLDNCGFNPTAGGTTDWTFASRIGGYNSPADASVTNGSVVKYHAFSADRSQWEIGEGAYNTATGVLARTTVMFNSLQTGTTGSGQSGAGTKINFSLTPTVIIVALLEDLLIRDNNLAGLANKTTSRTNLDIYQSSPLASSQDFNNVTAPGTYYTVDTASTNTPPIGSSYWYLTVHVYAVTNYIKQTATLLEIGTSGQTFVRIRNAGSWGTWKRILFPDSIRGYLGGLNLSTAGSSSTFNVTNGVAADSTTVELMNLGVSSINKTTSGWTVGTNVGALNTGSIAANTWYEVHLIKRLDTGVVDVMVTTTANNATLPTNYTLSRRIGWLLTDGASLWKAFTQLGDAFYWTTPVADYIGSTISGTTRNTLALTAAPSSIALFRGLAFHSTTACAMGFAPLTETDLQTNAGMGFSVFAESAGGGGAAHFEIPLNSSRQFAARSQNSNSAVYVNTFGWRDTRGQYA